MSTARVVDLSPIVVVVAFLVVAYVVLRACRREP